MANEQDIKINTLETMMEQNNKDHENIKLQQSKDHKTVIKYLDELSKKLDCNMEKMEKKFSPMWVRNVVVWVGGVIGAFLILFVLNQLFIN